MARRKLGHVGNFGEHASTNTARTTREKAEGMCKRHAKGLAKENQPPKEAKRRSGRVKAFFQKVLSTFSPSKSKDTPSPTRCDDATRRDAPVMPDVMVPSISEIATPADILRISEGHQQEVITTPEEIVPSTPLVPLSEASMPPQVTDSLEDSGTESDSSTDDDIQTPPIIVDPRPYPSFNGTDIGYRRPPNHREALEALATLRNILHPRRDPTGRKKGFKSPSVDGWSLSRLRDIEIFLNLYTSSGSPCQGQWMVASETAVRAASFKGKKLGKSPAQTLRNKAKEFIRTRSVPNNPFSRWNSSVIDNMEFQQELSVYLQGKGKYVKALDVVEYTKDPDTQARWGIDHIALSTAYTWLHKMGWRWTKKHCGLYVDGHERSDVVKYRKTKYIPRYLKFDTRTRTWTGDDMETEVPPNLQPGERPVVFWYHDESVFYAHDRREAQWVAPDTSPEPYAKGEGVSLMVADFVSADYGWLRSPDGTKSARVIFRPGKNRDGYFVNENILEQVNDAMDILEEYYPNEDHVFIYDNATTHQKRAANAPSARHMPKKPNENFFFEMPDTDDNGLPILDEDGDPVMVLMQMARGEDEDGNSHWQDLYFPETHPKYPGFFKGMAVILEERGYDIKSPKKLNAECHNFKCDLTVEGPLRCCCRRILFNEPDFTDVKSILEETCEARGFSVLFLPKFHCELNPIEMCWGRAKYHYRLCPPSSKEADLESNMLAALGAVTMAEIRRYARRTRRFLDAYDKGLSGKMAVWACRKYHSHRVLPDDIMAELDNDSSMVSTT